MPVRRVRMVWAAGLGRDTAGSASEPGLHNGAVVLIIMDESGSKRLMHDVYYHDWGHFRLPQVGLATISQLQSNCTVR